MNLVPYQGIVPQLGASCYISEGVQLIGDVHLGECTSVWFNSVLRADLAPIRIGQRSNIQDLSLGHVNSGQPLLVGDEVSVGHGAIIHGCTIGRGSLIGMGAIILNGAQLGEYVMLGAGSVVTERTLIPPYTLAFGTPAKAIRELTESDLQRMTRTTLNYLEKAQQFLQQREGR